MGSIKFGVDETNGNMNFCWAVVKHEEHFEEKIMKEARIWNEIQSR